MHTQKRTQNCHNNINFSNANHNNHYHYSVDEIIEHKMPVKAMTQKSTLLVTIMIWGMTLYTVHVSFQSTVPKKITKWIKGS